MRKMDRGPGAGRRRSKRLNLGLGPDDPIEYTDIELLSKCVGAQGQIFSRRRTGLSAKRQRTLKQAIKRARHLALLPFVG
jgi:small subunit ribosomal protein S18